MGNYNPGKFRREGREAFEPYCDPADFNPYLDSKSFYAEGNAGDWLEGWKEAEAIHDKKVDDTVDWTYLGDGVYAKVDQCGVWLHANSHCDPTDKIYLEWSVLDSLNQKAKEIIS